MRYGALAEFIAVKAEAFVAPAPQNLTDQQCAALPFVGLSAWNALVNTAELEPGMKVLIHGGSGGIGSLAIQLARHIGAEVYATCGSANVEIVEELGAKAIAYDRVNFADAIADCDVVLDTVGGEVHENSYAVLKKYGRLIYFIAEPFHDRSHQFEVETRQVVMLNRAKDLHQVMSLAAMADLEKQISAPLSLHFGDADVATPKADVAVLQEAFKGHENVEVVLHEGDVKHGFSDPGSNDFHPAVYKETLAAVHGLLARLQ